MQQIVEMYSPHGLRKVLTFAQQVGAPDDLAHAAIAHGRQVLTDLAREEQEEFQPVDRLPLILRDELLALRGHAHRTRAQVAHALLHAADGLHEDRAQADGIGAEEEHFDGMRPRLNAAIGHQFGLLAQAAAGQHDV
jgi:hypothetical protein